MVATNRLNSTAKVFNPLPRGLSYAIVAYFGNDDGVVVFDVYGRSKSYYSSRLRDICSQLPQTNVGKLTSGLMPPGHQWNNKNRRRSAKERKRREEQRAKDLAALAENAAASTLLTEQKAALAAKNAEDHRQMQISKSAAEKTKRDTEKAETHRRGGD